MSVLYAGPMPWVSSCARIWVKNESKLRSRSRFSPAPVPRCGSRVLLNFASCTFFSMTRLLPFSLNDAFVIRQIISGGPNAVGAHRRKNKLVDHTNRRQRPDLGIADISPRSARLFSISCKSRGEELNLVGFGIVAQGYIGFERRLVPK